MNAAVTTSTIQQQIVNQQAISSSNLLINGTTTTVSILDSSRQRQRQSISDDELLLNSTTNFIQIDQKTVHNPAVLILIIIVCSLMSLFTIVGNLVVILTVCLVRKLQTASNILIVSLAVSDIFVGLFIMPLALSKPKLIYRCLTIESVFLLLLLVFLITGTWKLGPILCDMWTSTDVLLCSASILNFLVISIDRYFIINHPFKYAPMRNVKLLSFMIAGVWILSALVSFPPILGWGRKSSSIRT